jgi:hypothetical protein
MSESVAPRVNAPSLPVSGGRKISLSNRYIPPLFITTILVVGNFAYGILESYEKTALAIVAALVAELVLGRIFFGKWINLASAYISGISVGILIRSPALWPYALCSVISIMSKYVLRVKGRHLWNPSNFGICVLLFLAPDTVAALTIQWGNFIWPLLVIWILGFGNYLACRSNSHQCDIRRVVLYFWISAQPDYGRFVVVRDCADNGADVPAICFLHGYGSKDDGTVEKMAMHRGCDCGVC